MGKFKLICGLGNKDKNKVKDLVLLWLKAGAEVFDTSASALPFVQKAVKENGFNLNDYEFCTSVSIEGDVHGKKARINLDKCKFCRECEKECIEYAIKTPYIEEEKCVGCTLCKNACKYDAIEIYDDKTEDFDKLLLTDTKIDILEVHISIEDKEKIIKDYETIISKLKERRPKISVSLSRKYFSNLGAKEILETLKEKSNGLEFIVQADGMPMNGGKNSLDSTVESVAFGLYIKSLGYDVTISGGCNEHTAKLAKMANLDCSIGYGSYARKLTDGLEYNEALRMAEIFTSKTKEILNS